MESTIHLRHSPIPSVPLHLSSAAIRASRFHLRSSHVSLSAPLFPKLHYPVGRSSGHVNCVNDNRFSVPSKNNEESDNKILRGVTGISLVLACVLGLFNFTSKMNPKFNTAYAYFGVGEHSSTTKKTNRRLIGGELALESLLKVINAEPSKQTLPKFPRSPSISDIEKLKLYAAGLSKSRKPDEAFNILEREYKRVQKQEQSEPEAELFLGMALVELLIFQRKFEEALRQLDSLLDEQIYGAGIDQPEKLDYQQKMDVLQSDKFPFTLAKPHFLLYKAIVHTMLGHEEAPKWGEAFGSTLTGT